VLLTLASWLVSADWLRDFIRGQLAYGIAALSFLGGIHWGAVVLRANLSADHTRKALIWGVAPTIIAWFSTMAGGFGFALLIAGFIAAYQADKRLFPWYGLQVNQPPKPPAALFRTASSPPIRPPICLP